MHSRLLFTPSALSFRCGAVSVVVFVQDSWCCALVRFCMHTMGILRSAEIVWTCLARAESLGTMPVVSHSLQVTASRTEYSNPPDPVKIPPHVHLLIR